MAAKQIETLIIGAGQAGLSTSYFLTQAGREHILLEKAARPAQAWTERWDSFTLVTPNWSFQIPGAEYDGSNLDGYMDRAEILRRFEAYVARNAFPLECAVTVTGVDPADGPESRRYRVETSAGAWQTRNVVVAAGQSQFPNIPSLASQLPADILQIHTSQYRSSQALPPGAVLVIGSGQSGCQIAEELNQAGRQVYLSLGGAGRAPRRYRGQDIYRWLVDCGFMSRTVAQLPSPQARFAANPQVTGKGGGHMLDVHQFYRDGITLLGRFNPQAGTQAGQLHFAPNLKETLDKVEQIEGQLIHMIDAYIAQAGIDAPPERLSPRRDAYAAVDIPTLDLPQAGVRTIIWAMGYRYDYSWVRLPVLDQAGYPDAPGGLTSAPGLYFVGMGWLPGPKTGHLIGVGGVAGQIASRIAS